ncbi:hypothetical protein [uncultured Psychroserpens sp.]|uniref:hypothetical protein n=1 Tax=uncultured Psychroserpens sp. TaxID=255436 RepID=UPI00261515FE|nr:hypothetical protein [uncultured Psychroserpens sp.]
MHISKISWVFIFFLSYALCNSQNEIYNQTALDSIYEHFKADLGSANTDPKFFEALDSSIQHLEVDTTAALYYHKFANLRLNMGHWDSIAEQMHKNGYERLKSTEYQCKLAISQFNLTRFSLFQNHPNTLDRAKHSLEIAKKCGELERIAHAQSYIGAAYININDYKNALTNLLESEKNYTTIKDSTGIAMVNLDLAIVYTHFQEDLKSIASTKKAAMIYKKAGKTMNYAVALIDMSSTYLDMEETDSVLKYLPVAHEIVKDKHQLANAYVYQHYGNLYGQLGRHDEAITNLKTGLKINESIDDRGLNINFYSFLVDNYKKKGNNAIAYKYALKSDSVSKLIDDKYEKLKSLLTLANTSHDVNKHEESRNAFLEYIKLKDSILGAEKQKEVAALEKFYEAEKRDNQIKMQQQENDLLTTKNTAANNRNIALVISLLLLAAIAYALINKFRLKATKQEAITKVTELENDNLNQKIEYQKRELASKALHIAQKNEMLIELKEDLTTIKRDNTNNTRVNHLINKLHIDKQIDDNWEQFTTQFIEMNPSFYKSITELHNDLTKNDIRLIALLKMKYDSNSIASLLNISLEGVKKARYRLRKKLNLSSEENLEKHIMSF